MARPIPLLLLALPLTAPGLADVRCAAIFGDQMVLQRQTEVAVWGWGEVGEPVTVRGSWNAEGRSTVTGKDGRWQVRIPTPAAGGPHTLTVTGRNELVFEDVLIGEVWLASGQSNMEWPLRASADPEREIAAARHPRLRTFDVAHAIAMEPKEDVEGHWTPVTPESAAGFSAVAYYFGRELQAELDVPVGLIGSNWGGTRAEAWTSRAGLADFAEFTPQFEQIDRALAAGNADSQDELRRQWWRKLEAADAGQREQWMAPELDDGAWKEATLPGRFSDFGFGDFDGCMWYRRTVVVPADWTGRELVLELGPIDDMDLTYFNGRPVAATRVEGRWQAPRRYAIPAQAVRPGESNAIAVCCVDTGGAGAIGLGAQMRLCPSDMEEGGVELAGTWRARPGLAIGDLGHFPARSWFNQHTVTALHNGMIAPIVPFGIRGVIWYQGESNRAQAVQYRRLFPSLIRDWRRCWGQELSFYFVQLAPFHYRGDTGQLAALREAQAMTLELPATGMAVTMDIGDVKDIHPRNKMDVGKRLARWALAQDYGQDVVTSGPRYRSMTVAGASVHLRFDCAEGLHAAEGGPRCFTVAGADRVFHPAQARLDGEALLVRSEAVPDPVAVRYCWGTTDEGTLFNGAGLPASSFRTDTWPLE